MSQVTEKDLKAEVEDVRERYRSLKNDDLFVAWFMKCFVTDTEEEAVCFPGRWATRQEPRCCPH